jgi:hypothetical protein
MFTQKTTAKTWYHNEKLVELEKQLEAAKSLNRNLGLEMIQLRGQYDQLRLKLRKESV